MHIHILGVCGTFMSGIALLAKELGHEVSGSDANVYPPMSTQLGKHGITLQEGYQSTAKLHAEQLIIGNVISRGNPAMEYLLNNRGNFTSGPAWLREAVLRNRQVIAVAGTHGKTTTSSLIAWILEYAGLNPGFLIGGIPKNFGVSARLGKGRFFVVEADEYDSAFFDKRPKFIHYLPHILALTNLEYDHADIFPDLKAIKLQFHYLIRTVAGNGQVIYNAQDENLMDVLTMGCWSATTAFGLKKGDWQAQLLREDGSEFAVYYQQKPLGIISWQLIGQHNVQNALTALAVAAHAGVDPAVALAALPLFKNVKRRLEVKLITNDITFYDDFAHHPTAIKNTLTALRNKIGDKRLIAIIEFGSYTMRSGVHKDLIAEALAPADLIFCKNNGDDWGLQSILANCKSPSVVYQDVDSLLRDLLLKIRAHDHVIIMSNTGFGQIHEKLTKEMERLTDASAISTQ